MKKRGFTLIEIIICITLLSFIGIISVVTITNLNNSNNIKKLNNAYKVFDNALDVYLETHEEVYKNLSDNVEGAIVTFETLKNEGLVSDNVKNPVTNKIVDYKNTYYVLSDAIIEKEDEIDEDSCDGRVEISVLKSWETLSKKDLNTSDIIYICPKNNNISYSEKIKELEEKIDRLENALSLTDLGSNNWVIFDVNSDKNQVVSFSDDTEIQDLWQVVDHNYDKAKLIYGSNIKTDNEKLLETITIKETDQTYKHDIKICDLSYLGSRYQCKKPEIIKAKTNFKLITFNNAGFDLMSIEDARYYKLIKYNDNYYLWENNYAYDYDLSSIRSNLYVKVKNENNYVRYNTNTTWSPYEMFKETFEKDGSKKQILYNQINENIKNSLIKTDYVYKYTYESSGALNQNPNNSVTFTDVFGTINPNTDGLNDTEKLKTYLNKNFAIGFVSYTKSFKTYYGIVNLDNGNIKGNSISCDLLNETACPYTSYTTNSGNEKASYLYFMNDNNNKVRGSIVYGQNYIPVIQIKGSLLSDNIDKYPDSYKVKRPSCTSDKLGSKECPRLFALNNGYYSNGDKK